jgi:membrane protein DedA with SNARE-associated domain
MKEWIESTIASLGYPGLTMLMFLENVFPPIPSELIMPLAGFVSESGRLSFWGVVFAGTLGSVLGALPLYYLGRVMGYEKLSSLAEAKGRWIGVSGTDISRAHQWFERYGNLAVFFGRLIPGIRSLISIPAGINSMAMPGFLAFTALGSFLWTLALAFAGKMLGRNYERVEEFMGPIGYAVLGVVALSAVWFVLSRRRKAATRTP